MRSSEETLENGQRDKATQLILKVMPVLQRVGFSTLKMDDIAKYMDISKATLYKYFSSKEALVDAVIAQYTAFLEDAALACQELGKQSGVEFFDHIFKSALTIAVYASDVLLQDVKAFYPNSYEELSKYLVFWEHQIQDCLELKKKEGVLLPCHPRLTVVQLDTMLRRLLDVSILMRHDLTMQQALMEFYIAFRQQIVQPEWIFANSEDEVCHQIAIVVKKLAG